MSARELAMMQLAAKEFITPRIVRIRVVTEVFPFTLESYADAKKNTSEFEELVDQQIMKLHRAKILHGNLRACNIGLNPHTRTVKLLNFAQSYMFDEVDELVLAHLTEVLEPEKPFTTLAEALTFERTFYKRGLCSE